MLHSSRAPILLVTGLVVGGFTCTSFGSAPTATGVVRQPLEIDDPAVPVAGAVMTRTGTDTVYVAGLLPTASGAAPRPAILAGL